MSVYWTISRGFHQYAKPGVLLVVIALTTISCSTINLTNRKGKDAQLSESSYHQLEGVFQNGTIDSLPKRYALYSQLKYDTAHQFEHLKVRVTPIDASSIRFELLENDEVLDSLTLEGKYRRGYFKAKKKRNVNFIAGPLLWIVSDSFKCLGITKGGDMVIINSGGSGIMWFIILPVFVANAGQSETEYSRIK